MHAGQTSDSSGIDEFRATLRALDELVVKLADQPATDDLLELEALTIQIAGVCREVRKLGLRKLYAQGRTMDHLADVLGVSRQRIGQLLREPPISPEDPRK